MYFTYDQARNRVAHCRLLVECTLIIWIVCILATVILMFLISLLGVSLSTANAQVNTGGAATPTLAIVQATPTVDLTVTVLAKQKLQEDVDQGQRTLGNWLWANGAAL